MQATYTEHRTRRATARASADLLANVFIGSDPMLAVVEDVSQGGMRLRALGHLQPRAGGAVELEVELDVPDGRDLVFVRGTVVHVGPGRVGIELRLDDAVPGPLARFLAACGAGVPV